VHSRLNALPEGPTQVGSGLRREDAGTADRTPSDRLQVSAEFRNDSLAILRTIAEDSASVPISSASRTGASGRSGASARWCLSTHPPMSDRVLRAPTAVEWRPCRTSKTVSPSEGRLRNGDGALAISQRVTGAAIRFDATLYAVGTSTVLRLPETASKNLPSRGQVAVHGTIDGAEFQTVLEPDGTSGHWMRVAHTLQRAAGISVGDTATLEVVLTRKWPEPGVPEDLANALASAPQVIQDLWSEITPMARWEWVRWVNATKDPKTRRRRVDVSISKMRSGKRRPCCFDLSACTDADLSRGGKLLDPADDRP
jgi:hypothetical protein